MRRIDAIMDIFEVLDPKVWRVVAVSNQYVYTQCDDYAAWASGYPWDEKAKKVQSAKQSLVVPEARQIWFRFPDLNLRRPINRA